jgi:hypothetical protein
MQLKELFIALCHIIQGIVLIIYHVINTLIKLSRKLNYYDIAVYTNTTL